MTAILGISAFYHDSGAALLIDGRVVAAAQEERFTRVKHDASFPTRAVEYCLREAGLAPQDVDYVAFYEKPFVKFERLLETYLAYAPRGFDSFRLTIPSWLKEKLFVRRRLRRELIGYRRPLVFLDHHESHAASAFFPSPFDEAAILALDGVGEWTTAAMGVGEGNRLRLTQRLSFPHSLGMLYSAFTYYCGFAVNDGEYKLMGLAPYGEPRFFDLIYKHLLDLKPDGTFRLDMRYFNFASGRTMTGGRFDELFGGPPRRPDSNIEQRHKDLAASVQKVTEEIVLRLGRDVHRRTGKQRLVLAGGVALNCVANAALLRDGPFDDVWIQPAAGDAGGALGAAWFVWHQLLDRPRQASPHDAQSGSLLGPHFSSATIRDALSAAGCRHREFAGERELVEHVADELAAEKVVGWFQGRMEYGPRALGARSILADPRSPQMQSVLNQKIKRRESFRPFAPAVLRERVAEWFDVEPHRDSPYMMLTMPVRTERRASIPAVTHVDGSARVQTVDADRHPRFHALLQAFERHTGCPLLVNTSFNVRDEPIVCTPDDAIRCFLTTEMDVLVLEDCVVHKRELGETRLPAVRSIAAPSFPRRVYELLKAAAKPVEWLVSQVVAAVVYYGVFMPVGLLFRITGRDVLQRRFDRDAETYWKTVDAPPDARRYFRQF